MLVSYKKPKGRFFIVGKPGGSPTVMRHISVNVYHSWGTLLIDGTAVTLDANNTWEADIADGTQITMQIQPQEHKAFNRWNGNVDGWENGYSYDNPVTITVDNDYTITSSIVNTFTVNIPVDANKYSLIVNNVTYTSNYQIEGYMETLVVQIVPQTDWRFEKWVQGSYYYVYDNPATFYVNSNYTLTPDVLPIVPDNEIWYVSQGETRLYPNASAQDEYGNDLSIQSNTYYDGYGRIAYDGDIHHIKEYFFQYNSDLLEIYLPDGMKEVYSECIMDCANLRKIVFGNSLEELGNNSFANNTSLTAITIPPSFESVYIGYTFSGCTGLHYIDMQANHFSYEWGGYDDLFSGLNGTYGTFRISQNCELYNMFVTQFQNYGWTIESY